MLQREIIKGGEVLFVTSSLQFLHQPLKLQQQRTMVNKKKKNDSN